MEDKVRTLILIGAILFGVHSYNKENGGKPTPPVVVDHVEFIVESETEVFPTKPSESLQASLMGLDAILKAHPNDALVLARAYKHWAILLSQENLITDLNKFQQVRAGSLQGLLLAQPLEGTYSGTIDAIFKRAYENHLADLKTDDGVQTEITPAIRAKLVDYFNAISWKCSMIWLENKKPSPQGQGDDYYNNNSEEGGNW